MPEIENDVPTASDAAPAGELAATAARAHRILDPLHSLSYFVPETEQALVAVGLRPGRMCYFAGRAAPMGAVGPGVVVATFYNFAPELVGRHIPRAWTLASPAAVVAARFEAAEAALTRLLGPEQAGSDAVVEAAALAREAIEGTEGGGRPLYSGHADLDWPASPLLQLWHAITLIREHRGDGHLVALVQHGLSGIDALVSHTATGRGFLEPAARRLRAWSDAEWDASVHRLRERGVLQPDGLALTAAGEQLRERIEQQTNELATQPWLRLGPAGTARLLELAKPLTRQVVAAGAFPDGVFASR